MSADRTVPEGTDGEGTAETLAARAVPGEIPLPRVERSAYAVGGEVARGGLGRIVQAVDRRLDRPVAIKELLEARRGPDLEARFAREALLTARLQHPAIVPVYEAGVWEDGSPFFAMKLVSGKSLEAAVRDRATLAERLELLPHVIDAVEALAYAHERRIIHRDLKPANVLVGAYGETVVIDWGLAKDLGERRDPHISARQAAAAVAPRGGETVAGSVLGTPAYMPPEQALGSPVDERADVYSLGALLYHVLGGGPPYSGVSSEHVLTCVIRDPPEPLLEKEPAVPPDLHAIVQKAMAREPRDRYRTAAALADDLNRYQRGQLVGAHRYSRATLLARWLRRHRAAVTVAAAMLAVLVAVVVVAFRRVVAERDLARAQREEAQRMRARADARGDELALREAEALLGRDPRAALGWLARLSPDSRAFGAARTIAADALARGVPARVADATVYALAFSSDGKLVAMARGGDVLVDDVASGQRIVLAGRGGDERALAFSPSGRRLAFGGLGGSLRLWDRPVGASTELPGHGADVVALAFAGDDVLASVARDGTLRLTRIGAGADRRLMAAHTGEALDVDATAGLVATAGGDGVVQLWSPDAAGDRPLASLRAPGRASRLALSGSRLAALVDERLLRVWDVARREVAFEAPHDEAIGAFAWLDGDAVATGDTAGVVWIWDLARGRSRKLAGHEDGILALAAADGALLSAGRDHEVRLWDPAGGTSRRLLGHAGDVLALAGAGPWIASASRDRTVRVWRRDEGQPRAVALPAGRVRALAASADGTAVRGISGETSWAWTEAGVEPFASGDFAAIAVSADGARVALGTEDGRVLLGDAPVGQLEGPVTALAFSPDGTQLAAAGDSLRLLDLERRAVRALPDGSGRFASLSFSRDGRQLAAGGPDAVRLWTVATGEARRLGGAAPWIAFAGDEQLVAAGADRAVRVWELAGGEPRTLSGLAGAPAALAVSPDGRTAAVGSTDGSVRLWDVGSGRGRSLGGHPGGVTALAFAMGGRVLASAGEDGALRLWPDELPHDPDALRALLLQRAPKE
jgi:WD40 repeat protein